MKTAAILVVYSKAFADTAIQVFLNMIRRIDESAVVIVVNNNELLELDLTHVEGLVCLQGSNVLHEFGAWQQGLDRLRVSPGFSELRSVVFANDTFCHYRAMGALEQAAFIDASKRSARASQGIACGEVSYGPARAFHEFLGVQVNRWIATYFFTLNRPALEGISWRIHPDISEVECWAPCGPTEEEFFSPEMDDGLRHRFCAWLFGRGDLPRWRRAAPLNPENRQAMRGKAHAMVCELVLAVTLLKSGSKIKSVFRHPIIYLGRRIFGRF
jgi:hypothetical protein